MESGARTPSVYRLPFGDKYINVSRAGKNLKVTGETKEKEQMDLVFGTSGLGIEQA